MIILYVVLASKLAKKDLMDVLFWREQLPALRFIAHAYHRHTIVSDRVVNTVYVCLSVCVCVYY